MLQTSVAGDPEDVKGRGLRTNREKRNAGSSSTAQAEMREEGEWRRSSSSASPGESSSSSSSRKEEKPKPRARQPALRQHKVHGFFCLAGSKSALSLSWKRSTSALARSVHSLGPSLLLVLFAIHLSLVLTATPTPKMPISKEIKDTPAKTYLFGYPLKRTYAPYLHNTLTRLAGVPR